MKESIFLWKFLKHIILKQMKSIILSFNEVTDFILENKFINPFTEEEISELEFSKMITTFFQFLRNF